MIYLFYIQKSAFKKAHKKRDLQASNRQGLSISIFTL